MKGNSTDYRPRLRPRWHKVTADLWSNKIRTILVVASIGIGLFSVGMIATIHTILTEDMRAGYAAVNPTNIQIYAINLHEDIVNQIQSVEGVQDVNIIRSFDLMIRSGPDEWSRVAIQAVPDFEDMTINQVTPVLGTWPPDDKQIVIEQTRLPEVYTSQSGVVEVKLPSGRVRKVPLVGSVHDQTVGIASTGGGFFMAPIQGFITTESLEWFEQQDALNLLYVTVTNHPDDLTYIRSVANQVTEAVEESGGTVYNAMVRGRHDHPNAPYVDAVAGVLYFLGLLVVFLSGFLITNTLQALLRQQSQQIAIMKTVGARSVQVAGIYIALIAGFGMLALMIALPLSREAAFRLLAFLSERINFDVVSYRTVYPAVALQVVIALVVPQLAGIIPVLNGARVKIQDVFTGSLIESDPIQRGWFDRQLAGLSLRKHKLPRPLLISLRNTFRHKGRLLMTLFTLTLGGAIFIATFNVQASLETYINRLGHYFLADVNVTMNGPYRISRVKAALSEVPGVGQVEGWAYARCELLLEDDRTGDAVQMVAPPADSQLIQPIMLEGRWILPGDQNAIVLSERFLSTYPNLKVNDPIRLRVNGEKTTWIVVGFFQLAGKSAGYVAYTNFEYLSEQIGQPNQAAIFRITGNRPGLSIDGQRQLSASVLNFLQGQGFDVIEVDTGSSLVSRTGEGLNTLTAFLLIMAVLTAVVGSIGLMGTMSMNVMDRTREIGVMRAIGASDGSVMNLVIVEGVLIGFISWVSSTLVAIPISQLLSDTIHLSVFDARADFTFTSTGPLYWLALVIFLSIAASVIPARSAARLTIREALAYE